MFLFTTTVKNMVAELADRCSGVTRSYMVVHFVFKIYCFASIRGITITTVKR